MQRQTPPPDPMELVQGLREEEAARMVELAAMLRDGRAKITTEDNPPPWLDTMAVTIAHQLELAAMVLAPDSGQ